MNSPLEVFCPLLTAVDDDGIIAEMTQALATTGAISDPTAFATAVHEREAQQRTWLGREAALPHARIAGVSRLAVALGRHPTGVAWGDPAQSARLIFLVAVPPNAGVDYLFLTQRITRTLRDAARRRALIAAVDADALAAAWRQDT